MPHFMFEEIEPIFNRALKFSFSRKKLLFIFPVLVICGILVVFSHTLAVQAHRWVEVSLVFLPIFICMAIFMGVGVPLIRVYHDEVKKKPFSYRKIVRDAWDLMVRISSFAIPLILAYLILWIVMGIFYLLKAIPNIGHMLGVVLSFGPFLLILGSLLLGTAALFLIFFITPQVALKSTMRLSLAEDLLLRLKHNFFIHFFFLAIGLIPLLLVIGFLILAATLTGLTYFSSERTWAIALQWFFIMIPFAALLSPAFVFFFNFSAESFAYMQRARQK